MRARRLPQIDKVQREVEDRLRREINYWDARAARLREEERAGKEQRLNAQNAEATASRLVERLDARRAELALERRIEAMKPVLRGAALIVPAGLLRRRAAAPAGGEFSEDPATRVEVERVAMQAVIAAERRMGFAPEDVSAKGRGWDVESRGPDGGPLRLLEVKGRHPDARTVTLTVNQMRMAKNKPDGYRLVLVHITNGFAREPVYIRDFATSEPEFIADSVNHNIDRLLTFACDPAA